MCKAGAALACSVPTAVPENGKERCIRPQFLCDGYNDCHNGNFLSDEFGCGKFLYSELPIPAIQLNCKLIRNKTKQQIYYY